MPDAECELAELPRLFLPELGVKSVSYPLLSVSPKEHPFFLD
jgi:hypothetical protein